MDNQFILHTNFTTLEVWFLKEFSGNMFKLLESVEEVAKVHTAQMSPRALIKIPFQGAWRNPLTQWNISLLAKSWESITASAISS